MSETTEPMTWREHVLAAAATLPPYVRSDWDGGPDGRIGFSISDGEVTFVVTLGLTR